MQNYSVAIVQLFRHELFTNMFKWDALRYLVAFVQFKKREKKPMEEYYFQKNFRILAMKSMTNLTWAILFLKEFRAKKIMKQECIFFKTKEIHENSFGKSNGDFSSSL